MTLLWQFLRTLEDSGEAAFICLTSPLLHSKLMLFLGQKRVASSTEGQDG